MHLAKETARRVLSDVQREQFVYQGFVKVESAFPPATANEARAILWQATGCDPEDRKTWTLPVVRLGDFAQEPFRQAVNTAVLHAAFDELVGVDRWMPRQSLGGFVVRFPRPDNPGDTGWHIDASFPAPERLDSYFDWRVNVRSDWRALLMLFLFSDVSEQDAPTRIKLGSHLIVPRLLAPAGDRGMSMAEISRLAEQDTAGLPEATAMGAAGTVYLCHPFLVHAGQPHRGTTPRFLGQPPLIPKMRFELTRYDSNYSLVEQALRLGLGGRRDS
jgi:hypothetical protein